jgi:phage tail sheath protein FI
MVSVSAEEQAGLNVDATSGKSINVIRFFQGKGNLVWGARTLAGNDNEWRYIPVRRLYIFVEESIKKATEFVVFEPNDANTWLRVKTMIENFLTNLWREGALAGAKSEQAFFVRVGLGQTMTALDILEGRMNVEIGLAAVRPAEFIILKFSHKLQES